MSQKNQKIIRDYCHFHGIKENKAFDPKKVAKRYKSLNQKARKLGLRKMISDLVRWNVEKYVTNSQSHPNFKFLV